MWEARLLSIKVHRSVLNYFRHTYFICGLSALTECFKKFATQKDSKEAAAKEKLQENCLLFGIKQSN
jgi:hypothetical protein